MVWYGIKRSLKIHLTVLVAHNGRTFDRFYCHDLGAAVWYVQKVADLEVSRIIIRMFETASLA